MQLEHYYFFLLHTKNCFQNVYRHIGPGFYAYKLNGRLATRQEKARLGRLIVRRIPELIPAIKSYPQRTGAAATLSKLFQSVKAKKRLTEIVALIAALFR
jgi:hypothetical protein